MSAHSKSFGGAVAASARANQLPFSLLAIAFFLPFTQLVQIQLIGTLFLQDLIAPAILVMLLGKRDANKRLTEGTMFYLLLILMLFGQIATDIYRDIPYEDYTRGWSRTVLLGINFAAIWLLAGRRMQVLSAYLLGTAISKMIEVTFFPDDFEAGDPWKFGFGLSFLIIAAIVGNLRTVRILFGQYTPCILLALTAMVSLLLNSRSAFGIAAAASLYSAFALWLTNRPPLVAAMRPWTFGFMILGGLIFVQMLMALYASVAGAGYLGESARDKYEMQATGGLGMMLGGRSESLVSFQAISDSPLLGHGSWARDRRYVRLLYDERWRRGLMTTGGAEGESDLIPSHSHLFGAWVEAGVLGGIFWIWVLFLAFRALYSILKVNSMPSALVVVCAMCIIWDVLFSPFGAEQRFLKAAQIAVLLLANMAAIQARKTRSFGLKRRTPIQLPAAT